VSEEADMERPVTRRELKEELGKLEEKIDAKIDALDAKLEAWGGALLARMDAMRTELVTEIARQSRAAMEWGGDQFRAVDDKYADLPGRVTRLERKVFPPKRARRR
jgi:hypothetical protein